MNDRPSRSRSTANVMGSRDVAGAQEVAVQRVRQPAVGHGRARGEQRLREHLAAEHPPAAAAAGCGPVNTSGVAGSSSSRRMSSTEAVGSGSVVMDGSVS